MISQQEAKYRKSTPNMKMCVFCSMFRFPNSCTLVEGKINPQGHCKFWENMLTGKGKPSE